MKDIVISLHETQKAWLEAKSRELGISQTEVVRRLIDDSMGVTLRSPYELSLMKKDSEKGKPS